MCPGDGLVVVAPVASRRCDVVVEPAGLDQVGDDDRVGGRAGGARGAVAWRPRRGRSESSQSLVPAGDEGLQRGHGVKVLATIGEGIYGRSDRVFSGNSKRAIAAPVTSAKSARRAPRPAPAGRRTRSSPAAGRLGERGDHVLELAEVREHHEPLLHAPSAAAAPACTTSRSCGTGCSRTSRSPSTRRAGGGAAA